MAIKYNPYGWEIRPMHKYKPFMLVKKEQRRDELIEELNEYKSRAHHEDITRLVEEISELQHEIDRLWNDASEEDMKPTIAFYKYWV